MYHSANLLAMEWHHVRCIREVLLLRFRHILHLTKIWHSLDFDKSVSYSLILGYPKKTYGVRLEPQHLRILMNLFVSCKILL